MSGRARRAERAACLLSAALLALVPVGAAADAELALPFASAELAGARELGTLEVAGLGQVRISGWRDGLRVMLTATGPDGSQVGRAETTIGLSQTPLVVRTPSGELVQITLRWASGPKAGRSDEED